MSAAAPSVVRLRRGLRVSCRRCPRCDLVPTVAAVARYRAAVVYFSRRAGQVRLQEELR